jgi:hypothetical protein
VKLRLKILAWVHIAFGGLGLGVLAALIGAYALARDAAYDDEFAFFAGTLGLFSIMYFLPSFVGGIGILRRIVWARWILWMEAAMLALAIPVGTVIAGLSLWALITTREQTADGGMAQFEDFVQRAIRPLVLALIALFTLGCIVGLGYLFRDVIDPPRTQVLTPMPSGVPPQLPERPEFEMPDLREYQSPREPGQ